MLRPPISPTRLAPPELGRKRRFRWRERPSPPCARKRLERLFPSHRLPDGLAGRTDRRQCRTPRHIASARRDPLRRQRRGRPARIPSRLRRFSPPRRDLRPRAVLPTRKLYYGRTRLLSAPSCRGRPLRSLREADGADDGRRGEGCGLLHEPDRVRGAAHQGPPLLIDQASSATAFFGLRRYAERGDLLPPGWAVDADGQPTTDPRAAMRGALLASGARVAQISR